MKRVEKREITKRRMLDAALYLFSMKPFEDVSIRDIAQQAKVSPALIYKYFDDQQHLYMEAMKIEARKLILKLEKHKDLNELVDQYIRFMFTEGVLYQMMAYFMLEVNERRPTIPTLQEIYELLGLFEQAVTPLFSKDSKQEAQLLFAALNGLLITYKNYPGLTSKQALEQILSLANRYISHLQPN